MDYPKLRDKKGRFIKNHIVPKKWIPKISKTWFKKGHIPWTKGKKGIHLSPHTEIKKGQHLSPRTEFKKGHIPWIKGKHLIPWKKKKKNIYSEEIIEKIRQARLKQKLPKKFTKIEILLQKELKKENIEFKTHVPLICSIPDIFIEPNICIFADGDYWHNLPSYKKRDKRINRILKQHGFFVFRFWEHEIKQSPKDCIKKIKEVLV